MTDKLGKAAGLELLQNVAGENVLTDKILSNRDIKHIKLLKLKQSAVCGRRLPLLERNGGDEGPKGRAGPGARAHQPAQESVHDS